MSARLPLVVGLLILSACGGTVSTSQSTPTHSATTSASATPAPRTSATASPAAGLAACGAKPALGILGAVASTATNPDGSARDPMSSFPTATTTRLILVASVQGLPAGTKLSFTRYLDGKFVDTRSALIAKPTTYFYFDFTVQPGQHIATGTYQVRLYVNEARACRVEYAIV